MRNKWIVSLLVMVLFAAMLPATAMAGGKQTFEVSVRNRTGAPAELDVVGSNGNRAEYKVPNGYSTITLEEGTYDYYLTSSCGNSSSRLNMNVDKTLWVVCTSSGPAAIPVVPGAKGASGCADVGVYVDWFGYIEFTSMTHWNPWVITWDQNYTIITSSATSYTWGCYDGVSNYYAG